MRLAELKNGMGDRAKVEIWLDKIGETDKVCRNEVLEICSNDREARAYFMLRYNRDCINQTKPVDGKMLAAGVE